MVSSSPNINKLQSFSLNKAASFWVGMGYNNEIVVAFIDTKQLGLFSFKHNQYTLVWKKPIPDGFHVDSWKFILPDSTIALRYEKSDPTRLYTGDVVKLQEFSGSYSRLVGTLPPDRLVYAKDGEVNIYSIRAGHKLIMTLLPPTGVKWNHWSSVCSHPDSAWIAVMNAGAKSVDIFNNKGEIRECRSVDCMIHSIFDDKC